MIDYVKTLGSTAPSAGKKSANRNGYRSVMVVAKMKKGTPMQGKRQTEYERGYSDGHHEATERALRLQDLERQTLIYWLLRAYQSGHREGWESSPSTDETMDGICSALANRGYDPNLSTAAKELLKKGLK